MITYAPKTASGFQKLSSSAIEIGNIPLITGPIFGIMLRTIAIKAFETTYLTSNIDKTINAVSYTHLTLPTKSTV